MSLNRTESYFEPQYYPNTISLLQYFFKMHSHQTYFPQYARIYSIFGFGQLPEIFVLQFYEILRMYCSVKCEVGIVVTVDSKFKNSVSKNWKKTDPRIGSYYSTTTLNILVSLECSHNFFQINNPKYADTKETGTKIGKMNFHNSCSNIITL